VPDIGWCENCNVPILDARECGICGSESNPIRSREVKPIFHHEKKRIRELLLTEGLDEKFLPHELSFRDSHGFILADGLKVLQISFSQKEGKWRAKKTKAMKNENLKLRGSRFRDVIKANAHILEEKEKEAYAFLDSVMADHSSLPVAVAFSGGKDSVVALSLARELIPNLDVVFLNTTIELPETVEYTRELAELWNLNLISVKPSHDFFELCKLLGPPSRFMKWCCKTQKFSPMNRLLHERYPDGVIMVRGVRAAESNNRSNYERLGKMKWTPNELIANPILDWTSLDSWLYIFWKEIPYNRAYEYGFTRLGCWACPAKTVRDFALLDDSHPELLSRLHSILDDYTKKRNLDKTWIRSGAWRIRKSRVNKITVCSTRPCSTSQEFVFSVNDRATMMNVMEFFKIFGPVKKKGSISTIDGKEVELSAIGKSVRIKFKDEDKQDDILRLLERALNCVGCGACQGVCEKGAIKQVEGKRIIDEEKCVRCLKCLSFPCISLRYGSDRLSVNFA